MSAGVQTTAPLALGLLLDGAAPAANAGVSTTLPLALGLLLESAAGGSTPVITSFAPGSGTTLVVAWTGTATEYRLNGGSATALPDGTSPDTITGLTPATTYTIELRDGAGAWSASASGTTDNTGSGGGGLSFSGGAGAAVSITAAGGGSALYTGSGGAGAAVTITAAGGGTAVALQRVVRLFLTSDFSAAYPASTSWHYALHESADPATWGAPLLQGSDGAIDSSGDFLLNVTSTALVAGDMPGLVLTDGTTDSTLPIVAFVGPVLVTEE